MRTSNSVVTETDSSNSFLQSGMSEEEFEQSEQSEQSELDTESGKVASETLAAAVSDRNIRLNVPQKKQENDYYCAVACLQMVLEYHGIPASQDELAQRLHTSSVTGTEYEDLAREASIYIFGKEVESDADSGYRAVLWERNEGSEQTRSTFEKRALSDLKGRDPVFVSINNAKAYENRLEGVHEVVLYGADLDENGNPLMWYCLDPSVIAWDGEHEGRKAFTPDQLWNAMNENDEPGYVW